MHKRLKHICSAQFGPFLRNQDKGTCKYLTASHFDSNCQPTKFENSYVAEGKKTEQYLLQKGDVLLAGKGHRLIAWAYQSEMGKCIASSLFYVLKLEQDYILPQYLALFLNSTKPQHQLAFMSSGATIQSLPKNEMLELKIQIPSLDKQQQIVNLAQAQQKEVNLYQEVLNQKNKLNQAIINQLINQEYEH